MVHERLGERFEGALSSYDTTRRVEVLVEDFLGAERLRDRRVLDVGCGLGYFSERAAALGGRVVACDLGPGLVERTRRRVGCEAVVADALDLTATFEAGSFDVVISSECIEHTPDPQRAVAQMIEVLRPGGTLALSTPNVLWSPIVKAATQLGFRPFDGHENFSGWAALRRHLYRQGMIVEREAGLHLFPFQLGLHPLSRFLDRRCQWARHLMINICIRAVKAAAGAADGSAAPRG